MDATPTTIDELFGPFKKCYVVPSYQRGYAWEKEQLEELWNDIQETEEGTHFLGSFVLQFAKTQEPQIIDGQQRLATLTILLCCIRDHYDALGMAESMGIIHTHYVQTHKAGTRGIFRIRLSDVDHDFFRGYIQSKPGDELRKEMRKNERPKIASHKRLWAARTFFYDKVAEELDRRRGEDEKRAFLDELEEKLTTRIRLIQIGVDDDDEAFLVFETLNDRGLSLSQADLLKNHLCMKRKAEGGEWAEIEKLVSRWDDAMQPLSEKVDVSVFLRHYLLSVVDDDKVRKEMIHKLFKKHVERRKARDVIDVLTTHAAHYSTFISPAMCQDLPTRRTLDNLLALRATQCYSLLLAAREVLSIEDFRRMARMAEVVTVRHSTICNRSARDLERLYHKCALGLRESAESQDSVLRDLAHFAPDDDVVKASFQDLQRSRTTAFVLRRIEESAAPEERVLEPVKVNMEHIMPLSLPHHWLEYLGVTRGIAEEHVELLGNLTLLGDEYNKEAQNFSFDRKKAEYYPKSKIHMTRELLEVDPWDLKAIRRRQQELADLACRTWDPSTV